jgi:hypothetical protein
MTWYHLLDQAVFVGGSGVFVGVGDAGVELGGRRMLVASAAIRVAVGATGVFVTTGGGAVVDPQPTKRNGKHATKAIIVPTTITTVSGEKRLLDTSFLLIRNNPMSRLSVQANIASSCHCIHWPKGNLIPRIRQS